jgi:tetratricopeptide (TPR) repeat protein
MKEKIMLIAVLVLTAVSVFPDDREIYIQLLQKGELVKLHQHLQAWKQKEPDNPEVYIGFFNYYVAESQGIGLVGANRRRSIQTTYDNDKIDLAIASIDEGIAKAPQRLDMYFGKLRVLGMTGRFDRQSAGIIFLLNHTKNRNIQWKWSRNEDIDNPESFLLDGIQGYVNQWMQTNLNGIDEIIEKVSLEEIRLYPNSVLGYSNMATISRKKDNIEDCEKYLLIARDVAPDDYIICVNLGYLYRSTGRKEKAREIWQKAFSLADDVDKVDIAILIDSL